MGKTTDVELSRTGTLKSLLGSGLFKPKRRTMKVRGKTFRQAQGDPVVMDFLAEAKRQDEELRDEGLIHP
jgi:hypothetical protein